MKIIHVVLGKANPGRMNGVNKVAYQLAKTQHELGLDVVVWGIANSLEHNYPERNFSTRLFKQRPNKLWLDAALENEVRQLPANTVVHLHGAFIPEFFHLSQKLHRRGIRYVYTPHGSLTEAAMQQSKLRKQVYFSLFEKKLIKNAKTVQLLGEQEYSYLDRLVKIPHKVLIPNGMDLNEIPALPEKSERKAPVFNFCGRLDTYHKGLDLMLTGFQLFLKKGCLARLELIGDGADRPALEQLADKLGIRDQVVFHGAKYGDEKYRLMAQGDLFLHTSRMEGFPMAVLEAAALGLPCLTSEPTNINSYVRRFGAGIALQEHTPERICEAMETGLYYFTTKKLEKLGENAREMVLQAFDWRNICRELAGVYEA
jgi:glycosyltransferase involved in cell wall biosynthesis